MENIQEAISLGLQQYRVDMSLLESQGAGDYFFLSDGIQGKNLQVRDMVPIHEWITSSYYLGNEAQTLYRYWRDVIVEFFEGSFNQLILGGSIRSGKSNTALLIAIRKLYELSCYSPIPYLFGLSASSLILFMYLSISMRQALLQGMGRIMRIVTQIPYFQDNFPRDMTIESYLRFIDPSVIMIGGSELGHFKGSDLFCLIFDEANFIRGNEYLKFDKAVEIYREADNRRKMTFISEGREQGLGIIISSANTQTAFVEKQKERAKFDSKVMIIDSIQYEVQPERYAGIERFWVFSGDDAVDPFLIEDTNALNNYCQINKFNLKEFDVDNIPIDERPKWYNPPVTFLEAFRLDIFGSLKEVCGISIGTSGKFFSNRVKYGECFPKDTADQHPFLSEAVTCSFLDDGKIEHHLKPGALELNPNFEYFGHIDQSLTTDKTGISMCHIDPEEEDMIVYFDFYLKILPPPKPAEISPGKIGKFFIFLHEKSGAKTLKVTMDTYASAEIKQDLINAGIEAEILSVDRDWTQYRSLSGSILDQRVEGYHYEPFRDELFSLVQDNNRKKVDHISSGSKDVSDGIAGAHWNALEAIREIQGGFRYFRNFTAKCLDKFKMKSGRPLYVGIYFGPNVFYAVWFYVEMKEKNPQDREQLLVAYVVTEYVDQTGSIEDRSKAVKEMTAHFTKESKRLDNAVYAGDPEGRLKNDITQTSPAKEYRDHGLNIRCRSKLDRDNFTIVNSLLQDKNFPRIIINESEAPILVKAFRRSLYKLRKGVRTSEIEDTGNEYPIYALRFALEEAFSKTTTSGY